jgi:hypothetical protein
MGYVVTVASGYMSRLPALPAWVSNVTFACFTRWGFQGLVINQFPNDQVTR